MPIEPGVTYIKAPHVWALGYTGQGIVVGGQDTGIQWDHPALKNHYRGWDGATANHDYNWHDSIHTTGSSCGANSPVPCDDTNHCTHTMGTAVGSDGGTNQIGVAPGAEFIGCRNMNAGNGTPATYLECFEFFLAPYPVAGTPAQGDPSKAPDVTNNSWGCPPSEGCNAASLLAAVQAQRAAGIMTVASAGNDGSGCNTVSDPIGIYDEVYRRGVEHWHRFDRVVQQSRRGDGGWQQSHQARYCRAGHQHPIGCAGQCVRLDERHVDGESARGGRSGVVVVGATGIEESDRRDRAGDQQLGRSHFIDGVRQQRLAQ